MPRSCTARSIAVNGGDIANRRAASLRLGINPLRTNALDIACRPRASPPLDEGSQSKLDRATARVAPAGHASRAIARRDQVERRADPQYLVARDDDPFDPGRPSDDKVEIYARQYVIVAQVMWRDGAKVGLKATDRVPVEDMIALGRAGDAPMAVGDALAVDRRAAPRTNAVEARLVGRAIETMGVGVIAIALAFGAWAMAQQALAPPFAKVEAALGGQS